MDEKIVLYLAGEIVKRYKEYYDYDGESKEHEHNLFERWYNVNKMLEEYLQNCRKDSTND